MSTRFYVNGIIIASKTGTLLPLITGDIVVSGSYNMDNFYSGGLDNIRVWNKYDNIVLCYCTYLNYYRTMTQSENSQSLRTDIYASINNLLVAIDFNGYIILPITFNSTANNYSLPFYTPEVLADTRIQIFFNYSL